MPQENSLQSQGRVDPKSTHPKPEFNQGRVPYPGFTADMNPTPDHGEGSYEGRGGLTDKVALITGADSGIGRAVALAFAREGADIALNYLPEEEKDGQESAGWVKRAGRKAFARPGDLRDEMFCRELVTATHKHFGRLDLLVNIAAFQSTHDELEEFSTEEFDRVFKTNVYALFWLAKTALTLMQEGSAIINTASIQAYDPSLNLLPYAASKAAIVSCTKGLSQLAMKRSVRVNAVAPGPVWTPLIPATMPEEKIRQFGKQTLYGRPAQPVEIAPVYVFLASNEARFVTGEVYAITGGQTPY